ncbi:MAG TPA: energy transducer TonB [Vicinamibacterales bacterium]|nr:energy transducer TonB [Vicinamibacterales bacterium]
MTIRPIAAGVLVALGVLASDRAVVTGARAEARLSSLYIVLHAFSDDLSGSYEELLDVSPVGSDVRVRVTRISFANPYCHNLLVRAAEQIIPRTTVERVTGSSACAIAPSDVDVAIGRAKPMKVTPVTEAASQTIVARCGAEERVFQFPWEQKVDRQKLRRLAPRVDALWRTYLRVEDRAFGRSLRFDAEPLARQKALEALGDHSLPDLVSGKYQAAYADWLCSDQPGKDCHGNYLAWYLRGYHGAPASRDVLPPELVDAARFRFTKYAPPIYPQIALAARVSGDVRLRLTVDPETGIVVRTDVLSGNTVLSPAAVAAASTWQFTRGAIAAGSVEVTLRFEMRCAG